MKVKFVIGAPSLTGKGANEEMEAALAGMEFPCTLRVVNHMPRAAVFPESGVELASAFASSGQSAEVMFASAPVLKRLLRSAGEVADLNDYAMALVVTNEAADEAVEEVAEEAAEETTDEELTNQVIEQNPELETAIKEGGGVDAAATLAETDKGESEQAPETSTGETEVTTNTDSDDNGDAAGKGSEAGAETPADATEADTAPKTGGKKSKSK